MALGSIARLAVGGYLLSTGSVDNIPLSTRIRMGFSIACPNQPPMDHYPVTVHLTECAALLVAQGSATRLVENVPNLLSMNLQSMTVEAVGGAALSTVLDSMARLADGGRLLAPDSVDDLVTGSADDLAPGLVDDLAPSSADDLAQSLVDSHRMRTPVVDDLAPSSADDLAPGLVDDLAPSSVDDPAQSLEDSHRMGTPVVDDLAPSSADDLAQSLVDSHRMRTPVVDDLAPSSADDLVPGLVDDLAPSSADDLAQSLVDSHRMRTPGWDILNLSTNIHSKEGALWTSIGSTGKVEDGCPLALESTH